MKGNDLAEHLADQGLAEILRAEWEGGLGSAERFAADVARKTREALDPGLRGRLAAEAADRFALGDASDETRLAGIKGGWNVGNEWEWETEFPGGIRAKQELAGRLQAFIPFEAAKGVVEKLQSLGMTVRKRPVEAWRDRTEGFDGTAEDRATIRKAIETLAAPGTQPEKAAEEWPEERSLETYVAHKADQSLAALDAFGAENGGKPAGNDKEGEDGAEWTLANVYEDLVQEIQDRLDGFPEILLARFREAAALYFDGGKDAPETRQKLAEAGFNVSDMDCVCVEISPDVWVSLELEPRPAAYLSIRRGTAEGVYERLREKLFERLGLDFEREKTAEGETGEDDYAGAAVSERVVLDEAVRIILLEWGLSDAAWDGEDGDDEDEEELKK